MIDWLKANKMYLLIGVVIMAALGIYYFVPLEKDHSGNEIENEWMETERVSLPKEIENESVVVSSEQEEKIVIDVKGAVTSPGVYEAELGDRVIDMINKAGGLLETADQNNINFALKVVDEMVLYIPVVGEQQSQGMTANKAGVSQTNLADEGKINLNKATKADLETLTGIGPAKADAIIEYRETKGPFKTIEDLMEISGFGEKTFEKLKENITVK
jgi:competence protein ComEA